MTEEWQNQQKTLKIFFAEADDDEADDDNSKSLPDHISQFSLH